MSRLDTALRRTVTAARGIAAFARDGTRGARPGSSMRHVLRLGLLSCILTASACVPTGKYDAAIKDAQAAHAADQQYAAELSRAQAEVARLNGSIAELQARLADREAALVTAQGNASDLQKKIDDSIVENKALRAELTRLGKNADALLAEKGSLSGALAEAKARLEELRKAQAASDARAALFRQLAVKFQKMIDAGQLKVVLRNGRMVLQLPNDVLFDSGKTVVKPAGKQALAQVATVLRTLSGRHFQVAGDTDNVPIDTALYPSNWELSTRRAVEVVHFLVAQQMRPELLSAAGYGEFDPIAGNDTPEGRAKNRRIEISLQPNIDELVSLPAGT